jgi:hypothetical protein
MYKHISKYICKQHRRSKKSGGGYKKRTNQVGVSCFMLGQGGKLYKMNRSYTGVELDERALQVEEKIWAMILRYERVWLIEKTWKYHYMLSGAMKA